MLETSGTKPSEMAYLLRPRRLGARGAVVLCALALVLAAAASWASPPPVRETLASVSYTGRLDLPGKPVAFQVTDTFLRVFGLGSLADLPPLHGEAAESAEPEETEGDDGQLEWK